jgi:CHASE2 domain-containing sensor protein
MPADRRVVVLVVPAVGTWAPPGRSPEPWRLALAEDTYEVLASLDRVDVAVAVIGGTDASIAEISALTWPNTPVYSAHGVLDAVEKAGPAAAVVAVSHDVPDLPGLLIGKLFRALGSADIAVCPAEDGSLAAIGVNVPPAGWVVEAAPAFDTQLSDLEQLKPRRHAVAIGPGWHRLRSAGDLARLDPGLEGWDATRSILRRG